MQNGGFTLDCQARGVPEAPSLPERLTRRTFLTGVASSLLAGTSVVQAAPTPQVDPGFWHKPRELWLKRLETGEQVRTYFWANGNYLPEGYTQLCWLLRDVRAKQAIQMDRTLLNVLAGLQAYYLAYGVKSPLVVTSGYRTFETNEKLAGEGAARNSMHLYGRAVDITLPGISVEHLGKVKQYLHAGGLGFYPSKHFIHLDTGRARTWRG
jgi:uncharacterized protein YcbK (DUF882 family)